MSATYNDQNYLIPGAYHYLFWNSKDFWLHFELFVFTNIDKKNTEISATEIQCQKSSSFFACR